MERRHDHAPRLHHPTVITRKSFRAESRHCRLGCMHYRWGTTRIYLGQRQCPLQIRLICKKKYSTRRWTIITMRAGDVLSLSKADSQRPHVSGSHWRNKSTVTSLLDTGIDQSLVNSSFFPSCWRANVKPVKALRLGTVNRQAVSVKVLISLNISIGKIQACPWFGIVEKFAVDLPLRTSINDRCIRGVFPKEWKVVPILSCHLAILMHTPKAMSIVVEKYIQDDGYVASSKHLKIFVSRLKRSKTVPPHTHCSNMVTFLASGSSLIKSRRDMVEKHQSTIAQGTMDIFPGPRFEVYIANLSLSPILFTKNMVVLYASKAPEYILCTSRKKPDFGHPKKNAFGNNNSWIMSKPVHNSAKEMEGSRKKGRLKIILASKSTACTTEEKAIKAVDYKPRNSHEPKFNESNIVEHAKNVTNTVTTGTRYKSQKITRNIVPIPLKCCPNSIPCGRIILDDPR